LPGKQAHLPGVNVACVLIGTFPIQERSACASGDTGQW
jgi:hypothetical protein